MRCVRPQCPQRRRPANSGSGSKRLDGVARALPVGPPARAGQAQPRRLRPYGSRTRSGQGRHRRSPAARDWNCSSLRCPRRVAGSVPEARASQSLAHRPLHPIRNGPVAFSDEGVSNFPRLCGTPWIFRGSEQARWPVHGLCEEGSPPGGGLGPFVSGIRKFGFPMRGEGLPETPLLCGLA